MANLKPPVSELDHIKGNPGASAQLVEYGDFQCPHCGAAHPIIKEVEKHFGDQKPLQIRGNSGKCMT